MSDDYRYSKTLDNYHHTVENQAKVTLSLNSFLNGVYMWMFVGLFATAAVAYGLSITPAFVKFLAQNPNFIYIPLIIEVVVVLALVAGISKISAFAATLGFLFYALLNGITFSLILLVYPGSVIASTFLVTSLTFGTMSIYGYVTGTDLTKVGNIARMAVFGLIICLIVNIFMQNATFDYIISGVGVLIFCALTAYDTQKLKNIGLGLDEQGQPTEMTKKVAILGALTLYLDFINLFLFLLRFMGRRD